MPFNRNAGFILRHRMLLTAVFFILCVHNNWSQTAPVSDPSLNARVNYSVKVWNTENGLKENNVVDVLQSSDGFIWLLFKNSLSRFDGSGFKTYYFSTIHGFPERGLHFLLKTPGKPYG